VLLSRTRCFGFSVYAFEYLKVGFIDDRSTAEGGKTPGKYVRYTVEDLERMLSEFFEGKTWGEQKR